MGLGLQSKGRAPVFRHVILSHVLADLNFASTGRCYPELSKLRLARLSLWSGAKMGTLFVAFEDFIFRREAALCNPETIDFYPKPFLAP